VLLASAASLCWGSADFLGGVTTRRLPLSLVLGISYPVGLAAIAILVAERGASPPSIGFAGYAAAGGLLGVIGIACLYRGLAVARMGTVAPIAATGPVVPVVYGLLTGDRLRLIQAAGVALALLGVVLVARERTPGRATPGTTEGVTLAVAAALCFGCALIAIDRASVSDPYWSTLLIRAASTLAVLVAVAVRPRKIALSGHAVAALVLIGLLDLAGTLLFAVSTTRGLISVVSAGTALPPLVVMLLARATLGERLEPLQAGGAAIALAGLVLISAG